MEIPAEQIFAANEIEDQEIIELRNTIIRKLNILEDQ